MAEPWDWAEEIRVSGFYLGNLRVQVLQVKDPWHQALPHLALAVPLPSSPNIACQDAKEGES